MGQLNIKAASIEDNLERGIWHVPPQRSQAIFCILAIDKTSNCVIFCTW